MLERTGLSKAAAFEFNGSGFGGARRTLLVVATGGSWAPSLTHALEREFSWLNVEQAETVQAGCRVFGSSVSLVLVDAALLEKDSEAALLLQECHPASITVVMKQDEGCSASLRELLGSDLVRGVLPMNLRLDIWLSVVRLMLRGGEYFPLSMLSAFSAPAPAAQWRQRPAKSESRPSAATKSEGNVYDLTRREIQVLELMSRGAQNKAIAAAFDLSEHTVKIHVHNIINKTGTSNRTEAAMRFRDHCQPPRA